MNEILDFGQPMGGIMQIAFITPDIEAAIAHYTPRLACGPWFVIEHFPLLDAQYRGQPTELDITLALSFSGSMCFELIQQNNWDTPSVYNEVQQKRGWGFHHFAIACSNFDDDVARYKALGHDMALFGVAGVGARAAYMDTSNVLPGMIELIEMTDKTEAFFAMMKSAAENWDGTDPVRVLTSEPE
ncbi:VOC family protein [Kordiimonas pumila]|uniref:VOC family protein n=1 Tax=Kordiimonas pumila TaxID=2161677 RepID=A0ABV7D504_9PROT|nr:VOC family protein [Kordiimonas pumila]